MDGLYEMSDDQIGWCASCGAAWFRLEGFEDSGEYTAVCVDPDGNVTGYSGKLVCLECDSDFVPGIVLREGKHHLRIVDGG